MLYFDNLNRLQGSYNYLSNILGKKQFFFVGGLIRDLLLDRETKLDDIDVTMAGNPPEIKAIIQQSKSDFSYFDTEKYGTMTIIPKQMVNPRGQEGATHTQFEITPFRTETTYSDGRHPDEVRRSNSLLVDSERRDFRMNCVYYCRINSKSDHHILGQDDNSPLQTDSDQYSGLHGESLLQHLEKDGYYLDHYSSTLILQDHDLIEQFQNQPEVALDTLDAQHAFHVLIDPHYGIQDMIHKKITAVGDANQRFQEDALRVVRGLRFAIALQCDFEKKTWTALQKNGHLIRKIAQERIKHECDKAFDGPNPFGFVSLLDSATILKWVFPKVYDNKGVEQVIRYHPFDVYTHTLLVLKHAQELSTDRLFRYAALYHDVGKVEQYSSYRMTLSPDDMRDVFGSRLNHSVAGEEFVREDFRRLGASNKEIETIARYVLYHMKPGEILRGSPDHYKKKLRKLIAEVGPEMVKNLCLLTIADVQGQYNPLQNQDVSDVYILIDLVDEIMADEGRFQMSDMNINGTILMKELGLAAGPEVGRILGILYEWVLDDPTRNDTGILLQHAKTL